MRKLFARNNKEEQEQKNNRISFIRDLIDDAIDLELMRRHSENFGIDKIRLLDEEGAKLAQDLINNERVYNCEPSVLADYIYSVIGIIANEVEFREKQLESTEQERQEQIAFIREWTEWAVNEAISWAEYLDCPLNEEQIAQLREEGLALAERMINDEEYIDYSNCELKDCIEQSITNIKGAIRDLAD